MKKTRFKIVAAAAALAMAFALAGCSGGSDATADDGNDTGGTSGTGTESTDSGTTSGGSSGSGDASGASGGSGVTTDTTSGTAEGKSPAAVNVLSASLEKNEGGSNNQAVVAWIAGSNEYTPKTGDVVKFDFTATADATASNGGELKGFVVDNTEAAGWWTLLSGYAESGTTIATDATDYSLTFTLTADASSADSAACKLGLYFTDMQDNAITLTFTKMKITYNDQVVLDYTASTAEPVTVVDVSTWTKNTSGYSAADAEVVDVFGEKYIKVITKSGEYNNMLYMADGVALEGYTKLTFKVYCSDASSAAEEKIVIEFLENTEGWPSVGSVTVTPIPSEAVEQTVVIDLSGTQYKKFDMIKVFVQETKSDSPAALERTVFLSSVQAQ